MLYVYKLKKDIYCGVFEALIAAHSKLEARALMLCEKKEICDYYSAGDLETMVLEIQDYRVDLETPRILMCVCYES